MFGLIAPISATGQTNKLFNQRQSETSRELTEDKKNEVLGEAGLERNSIPLKNPCPLSSQNNSYSKSYAVEKNTLQRKRTTADDEVLCQSRVRNFHLQLCSKLQHTAGSNSGFHYQVYLSRFSLTRPSSVQNACRSAWENRLAFVCISSIGTPTWVLHLREKSCQRD